MSLTLQGAVDHANSLPSVTSDFPFGPDVMTMRIGGKIFMFVPVDDDADSISLKGEPEDNLELRRTYDAIVGAFHLNKRHWNGIRLDGSVPDDEVCFLIEQSYVLVAGGLSKKARIALDADIELAR